MAQKEYSLDEINECLVKANRDCQTWLAARAVDKYLEACSNIEALEHRRATIAKASRTKALGTHNEDLEVLDDASDPAARLTALAIIYDGCRYYYYGHYRYDNLQCAIDFVELQRARGSRAAPEIALPIPPKSNAPSSVDRDLMFSAGVSFAEGIYHFEEYRYDKLGDALAYAALMSARRGAGKPAQ